MFLELLVVKDVVVILCGGLTQCLGRGRGEHLFEVRGRCVGPAGAVFGNEQAHDEHGSRGGGRQAVAGGAATLTRNETPPGRSESGLRLIVRAAAD